jgi:hypothetical protein
MQLLNLFNNPGTKGVKMIKRFLLIFTVCLFTGNAFAYSVYYNTNSHKYHQHSCEWAEKCTKNCISIDHTDAIRRGGVPCKVCGG